MVILYRREGDAGSDEGSFARLITREVPPDSAIRALDKGGLEI